jgi:chorismate lyase/3-hydroxybenzoate synthase
LSRQLDIRAAAAASAGAAPLTIEHWPLSAAAAALADPQTLGIIRFGGDGPGTDARDLCVPLRPLDGNGHLELWRSTLPVEHGWAEGFGYARNDEVMLAQLWVNEAGFASLERSTFDAYSRIQNYLQSQGYPHPVRIWNFLPDINAGDDDEERYKQFSLGRAHVIESLPDYEERLPAASAIGSSEPGYFIYLLAARDNGVQIENPRQVSAFHYPRQYGVRSPSFSRARLVRWAQERHLYLSGTASVVGHETLHVDDCAAQLQETVHNIESLLNNTASRELQALGWQDLHLLRVYLRNAADLPMVRSALETRLRPQAPVFYLQGDICRRDLAIEIEGLFVSRA